WFVGQQLKLNAALGASGLVERAGRDEFVSGHEVGRQAKLDDRGSADAQAGGVNGGSARVFAELSGVEADPLSRPSGTLSPSGGEGRDEGVAFRSNHPAEQRPAER